MGVRDGSTTALRMPVAAGSGRSMTPGVAALSAASGSHVGGVFGCRDPGKIAATQGSGSSLCAATITWTS